MSRSAEGTLIPARIVFDFGLRPEYITSAVEYIYRVLDTIDETLLAEGSARISELVELANLSAIVGNLFRGGVTKGSSGVFQANRPHTYPDLLGVGEGCQDIEIKVALETNKPKGHLAKPGPHLTLRYVLANQDGTYLRGKKNRGNVVWIWEIRAGLLRERHFSCSNTEGDSGKTAVINREGMQSLTVIYCDLKRCPHSSAGQIYREFTQYLSGNNTDQSLSD